MPFKNKALAMGLLLMDQKYGVRDNLSCFGNYAYRIRTYNGFLSFGLKAGFEMLSENQLKINTKEPDALFSAGDKGYFLPNFGFGIYFEWLPAGYYDVSRQGGGVMHRGASVITHIYYGFDLRNMFIRLDPSGSLKDEKVAELAFFITFLSPKGFDVEILVHPHDRRVNALLYRTENRERKQAAVIHNVAANDIIELALPFELLGVGPNADVQFFVTVERSGAAVEKWPYRGYIQFKVPTDDFEAMMWQV